MATTSCKPMREAKVSQKLATQSSLLLHWLWVLMGWVTLAGLGQRSSSTFSALPLLVWWAWMVARPLSLQVLPSALRVWAAAGLAVLGVWAAAGTGEMLWSVLAAAAWAQSCLHSQQLSRALGARSWLLGWLSPLLAAALVWLLASQGLTALWMVSIAVLLLGAVVLRLTLSRVRQGFTCPVMAARAAQAWAAPGLRGASAQAAQLSMGLMMCSLALSDSWCTQAGWPAGTTLGVHLLFMALAAGVGHRMLMRERVMSTQGVVRAWSLVAGGLCLLISSGPMGLMGCMACHSLAWGLSVSGSGSHGTEAPVLNKQRWLWAIFSASSLAVLTYSSVVSGPMVLVWAHAALSLIGGMALLAMYLGRRFNDQGRTPGVSNAMP